MLVGTVMQLRISDEELAESEGMKEFLLSVVGPGEHFVFDGSDSDGSDGSDGSHIFYVSPVIHQEIQKRFGYSDGWK